MGKSIDPWQEGRRAWKRLNGWQDDGASSPGHPDNGEAALAALTDVGVVHRILDQFELIAVRTARRHGKSWAEIATRLGVTRQSAWERWRDLDNADTPTGGGSGLDAAMRAATAGATADLVSDAALGLDSPSSVRRAARELRRASSIKVPNVIGMTWTDARRVLAEQALIAIEPGAVRPPTAGEAPSGAVTDQSPESGARVAAGSSVTLWVGRGGGSAGVREPRRPLPVRKSAHEERERSDEAVG
jgi:DNA-binding Lrp family transcriptional regulator